MKYMFDSSSIYAIAKAGKTQLLILNNTCSLARYELGNILLTESNLRKTIGEAEQKSLLNSIARALGLMLILDIKGDEQGIMDLAIRYKLSFYDASYVYIAKKNNIILVTQDQKLAKKINGFVNLIAAEELF